MFDKLHSVTLADLVQMLEVLENQHLDTLNRKLTFCSHHHACH